MTAASAANGGGIWRLPVKRPDGEPALSPAEMRVVEATLVTGDQEAAATAARVSLRTYQRYVSRENVQQAIADGAAKRLRRVTVALGRYAGRAAEALGMMAVGELPPNGNRIRACVAVIESAQRAISTEDHEQRLAEVEQLLEKLRTAPPPPRRNNP